LCSRGTLSRCHAVTLRPVTRSRGRSTIMSRRGVTDCRRRIRSKMPAPGNAGLPGTGNGDAEPVACHAMLCNSVTSSQKSQQKRPLSLLFLHQLYQSERK
jgi:hypothetical protein